MKRILGIAGSIVLGSLVAVFLLWDAIPSAACNDKNAPLYSPQQMRDIAFSNRALWGDEQEAACWFLQSARAGNKDSYSTVGMIYEMGRGVPKDISKAITWYKKAIDAGNSGGAYRMALLYRDGTDIEQSEEKAARNFELQRQLKEAAPPFSSESSVEKKIKSIYRAVQHIDRHILRLIGQSSL